GETVRYRCGGGTGLAIFERPMTPIDRTVAAFEVADIEAEVAELRGRGVEVEGVTTLPTGIRRAFFKDPDGNIIGMRQVEGALEPPGVPPAPPRSPPPPTGPGSSTPAPSSIVPSVGQPGSPVGSMYLPVIACSLRSNGDGDCSGSGLAPPSKLTGPSDSPGS